MSLKLLAFWLLAAASAFLVVTFAVWLLATPVEETTTVIAADGRVLSEESDQDLSSLLLPGAFLAGSLVCLAASVAALLRSRRSSRGAH